MNWTLFEELQKPYGHGKQKTHTFGHIAQFSIPAPFPPSSVARGKLRMGHMCTARLTMPSATMGKWGTGSAILTHEPT